MMAARADSHHVRVATYNIHKCRGLDGRVRPERIVEVLRELNADVIALQEVLSLPGNPYGDDHVRFIAEELGFHYCFGENRKHVGQIYGDALVSRFPLTHVCNYDISTPGREPRGCLRADVALPGGPLLHLFNIHMGTSFLERQQQVRRLMSSEILNRPNLRGARIVLGDFNEWTSGTTTRVLSNHFASPNLQGHPNRMGTYQDYSPFFISTKSISTRSFLSAARQCTKAGVRSWLLTTSLSLWSYRWPPLAKYPIPDKSPYIVG